MIETANNYSDLEIQLRTLGRTFLEAGKVVPEWVWADLHATIREQGGG